MTPLENRMGQERARQLVALAGGSRITVPLYLDRGRAPENLARRFGEELAVALILHFGGSTVYIPRFAPPGGAPRSDITAEEVARLTQEGLSAPQIAIKLKCSDRTVFARRAEARSKSILPA